MKRIFTLSIVLVLGMHAMSQPYSTGKRTISFTDNSRSARPIPTDIYYPANSAGNDVPLASGVAKFPVVVFGHGFLIPNSAYKWLADSLVKNGYVVALPATETGLTPSHLDFGLDLSFLCTRITSLNDSSASFLYQRLIKRAAVAGHSMGGGASFLAAATQNNSIRAVFNLAAAETTPPASVAAFLDFKPTLIFSGSGDCIAPDSVQEAMYDNIFLACKTYVNITDALHCQFANNNLICSAAQLISGCGIPSIGTGTVLGKTTSLIVPYLDYYLKDICIRGEVFMNTYNNLTGVTKRRSCLPFPSCGVTPVKLISFNGYVKENKSNLYWNTASEENFDHFEIERSADGLTYKKIASVQSKAINGGGAAYTAIDAYPYSGVNFYRLKIVDRDGSFDLSNVIKLQTGKKEIAVIQLYPNPATDIVHVELQSDKKQQVNLAIYDVMGKQVSQANVQLNEGVNSTVVNLASFNAGVYILQYKNSQGVNLGSFKVIRK